jgi:hypothetical protein
MNNNFDFKSELSDFIKGYVGCALWSTTDDAGDPLDNNFDKDDIEEDSLYLMVVDCYNFFRESHHAWAYHLENYSSARAGHDFWLTRCGHGAGFWDRTELEGGEGEYLTERSEGYGEVHLLVGDNGKLYYS